MISLDEMTGLARALLDADNEASIIETSLKAAKERCRQLREETIPSAMQELGLESLVLSTGQTLSIKQEVYASIAAGNKAAAFAWLDSHGFGGLIKTEVKTIYGKGEKSIAVELLEELQQRGLQSSFGESVHAQTLKAFLKEQIAAGTNVPLDLFGARPIWSAKIK